MNAQLSPTPDPFLQFKQAQKQGWASFGPLEALTIPQAARLWGLGQSECHAVVDALVQREFLRRTPNGLVARVENAR